MKEHPYWIKERHNPQLGIYYVGLGQMSRTAARKHERPMYGDNVMIQCDTLAEYQAKLEQLKQASK